jgi:hypothetical protein
MTRCGLWIIDASVPLMSLLVTHAGVFSTPKVYHGFLLLDAWMYAINIFSQRIHREAFEALVPLPSLNTPQAPRA